MALDGRGCARPAPVPSQTRARAPHSLGLFRTRPRRSPRSGACGAGSRLRGRPGAGLSYARAGSGTRRSGAAGGEQRPGTAQLGAGAAPRGSRLAARSLGPGAGDGRAPGPPGGVSGPPAMAEPAEERHCWVCFATEREDRAAEWVCPCRCKGSTKWIHQACLQRWLDEKQKGNSTGSVSCPQCGTEYRIIFPKLGPLVYFLHQVDQILSRASPFAMAGIVVGTVYWSAVTYGAVTVMQVVGHKKGLDVMERADPLFLLMGLPTIPVMLVLGRLIRWEDYVLRVWRKYSSKLQALQALVPGIGRPVPPGPLAESRPQSDHPSLSRTLCGALVFPTVASLVGRLLFRRVDSSLQRTILGGITFVAIKGVLKVYFRQQQYLLQANRRILDYLEPGPAPPDEDSSTEGNLS